MGKDKLITEDVDYNQIDKLYDECLNYLKNCNNVDNSKDINKFEEHVNEPTSQSVFKPNKLQNEEVEEMTSAETKEINNNFNEYECDKIEDVPQVEFKLINEMKSNETINSIKSEGTSERLRKLSQKLPRIIITQSSTSLDNSRYYTTTNKFEQCLPKTKKSLKSPVKHHPLIRKGYGDFPKRLVSKSGIENVALISNVPFEKIRMLNDTFHTLINLRWRWIVTGTVVVHFAIWLVFALFWYIAALAHYDFEPDPPKKTCVTGGKDFVTIFLASVEAQTTIGFGDRTIDEECPESIFLFIMQLILGTGLSGVLTCVVYAKLTRPEKLSRDGVGFSKKAVISMRDGRLCLMIRAWDLNYDHIINSEFTMHFVHTYRTKEGETIRYYANSLTLQQRQFLLWPVTLVHVIDDNSALFKYTAEQLASDSYEITVSLKGASASMGTFTQSQTSYLPREVLWGHRFPPVVKYDSYKQKYVIDHKKLDSTEPIETPHCSAYDIYCSMKKEYHCPGTPTSFSDRVSTLHLERSSSFRNNKPKGSQHSDHISKTLSF